MKTKFTLPAILILSIVLLNSCYGPKNILKLQPHDKNEGKWLYGQQFVADTLNGIIYEVGYERCQGEQYWFNFTVTNLSNLPILIDPSDFLLKGYNGYREPIVETTALNPENEILDIEKSLAKAGVREANHVGLSLLAASVDVATGVATATDDNPNNDYLSTNLYEGVQVGREVNALRAESLETMRDSWENSTVRKTTVEPNHNIKGKVFFPAIREASYIKLFLPVDSNFVEMSYEQIQIPVN
ncbi:hypothetical protein [Maribellus maritimus]|uniref:hypothetical protein n=1 Tax=Maribellus maritimus TaxID=2870838 RepID=UPI001EEBF9C5|nr:hypothetical protein [Maribellus maritimus]MCG6189230.1 hypothetical protein [Maribellus maritimus]